MMSKHYFLRPKRKVLYGLFSIGLLSFGFVFIGWNPLWDFEPIQMPRNDTRYSSKQSPQSLKETDIPVVSGDTARGSDPDPNVRFRRDFVVKMMVDAWDNYRDHAWEENELKPISKVGYSDNTCFGGTKFGATIVDAVDTLYIMGLNEQYQMARQWIAEHLDFGSIKVEVSVFEMNILFVGGFLSMYALTGDIMYKDKAYNLATKLLPAFDTPVGIPYGWVTLNGKENRESQSNNGATLLADLVTLHLEFVYLSDITGDPVFWDKVNRVRKIIKETDSPNGLYWSQFDPIYGNFVGNYVSIGPMGDSFYEYLLKSYVQTGDDEAREMYDKAMDAMETNGLIRYSETGLVYFTDMNNQQINEGMSHLTCFTGGLLALGALTDIKNDTRTTRHMKIAQEITNTCHESYIRTDSNLGPESFSFNNGEADISGVEREYKLRPEVVESYFVLWRLTKEDKYRDWGWEVAEAIQKHCKTGEKGGYSGLEDVYSRHPQQDDLQQSFFLAETLKYLYLLFSSNEVIDLSDWVFNTEGHPLPIKGRNPFYRPFMPPI